MSTSESDMNDRQSGSTLSKEHAACVSLQIKNLGVEKDIVANAEVGDIRHARDVGDDQIGCSLASKIRPIDKFIFAETSKKR
jgi:hypothetical protein